MADLSSTSATDGPEDTEDSTTDWETSSVSSISTLQSTTLSVLAHEFENGRRYHHYRRGRYPLPNDEIEQGREALKHTMTLELTRGKLITAPIGGNPLRILDLGTGTGQWAIEVGDTFPSAEIVGTDLSPIQPMWVPPNVKFVVDDMEDEWIHGSDFDLIHTRHVLPAVRNVEKLLRTAFENIKPGGWLEMQEFDGHVVSDDGSVTNASALKIFMDLAAESFKAYDMSLRIAQDLERLAQEAGFVNISSRIFKVPTGSWPRDRVLRVCGGYMEMIVADFIDAMHAKPIQRMSLAPELVNSVIKEAKEELFDLSLHAYISFHFITAQKPPS